MKTTTKKAKTEIKKKPSVKKIKYKKVKTVSANKKEHVGYVRKGLTPNVNKIINKFGGVTQLAKALGISYSAVYMWERRKVIPPLRAREIYDKFGKKYNIRLKDMRPDVF